MIRTLACALLAMSLCALTHAERFSFAALGDTPYHKFEERLLVAMIHEMGQHDLAFAIHVGDIKSGNKECGDWLYAQRLGWFKESETPFVLIPGDNDWTDCDRNSVFPFDPLERLNHFRKVFYPDSFSLGKKRIRLTRQSEQPAFSDYRENMRWERGGVLFITLHVIGSENNLRRPAEFAARHKANRAWLSESFEFARSQGNVAVVVAFQVDPLFELAAVDKRRRGWAEIMQHLLREVAAFPRPVLIIHGDKHRFRFDQPLRARGVIPFLPNLSRLEVYGSPMVEWTEVVVDTESPQVFSVGNKSRHLPLSEPGR